MTAKNKYKSPAEAIHALASGLFSVLAQQLQETMRHFDESCLVA